MRFFFFTFGFYEKKKYFVSGSGYFGLDNTFTHTNAQRGKPWHGQGAGELMLINPYDGHVWGEEIYI